MKSADETRAAIETSPRKEGTARGRTETEFLPAALEVVETPPSPIGRAIAATVGLLFAGGVLWAAVGTVDIVASAPGKIIPTGRTKVVQPFETSVIAAVHVRDGQRVKAGDLLVEFDSTTSGADVGRVRNDLVSTRLDVARLRAALTGGERPAERFTPPDDATPEQVAIQRGFLTTQHAEQAAKIAAIDWQEAQKKAEHATIVAALGRIEATLPILQQRVDVREHLMKKELGSKLLYLTEYQDLVGQRQDLLVQRSRLIEIEAALAGLVEMRKRTEAEYARALLDELTKAEQKVAALTQDLVKAERRSRLHSLTAPEDAVVQQLAVHTVGGVVTPAQTLMVLVPTGSRLEVEAMVSNRDVGFVEVGQSAAVKIDTFNFTRYGLVDGKVLTVSTDAIIRDKPIDRAGDKAQGAETTSSEPKGQELVYAARVSLDRTEMSIGEKRVSLSPGMAVTVEIKTGTRSIISYLLSPIARYRHETMRER